MDRPRSQQRSDPATQSFVVPVFGGARPRTAATLAVSESAPTLLQPRSAADAEVDLAVAAIHTGVGGPFVNPKVTHKAAKRAWAEKTQRSSPSAPTSLLDLFLDDGAALASVGDSSVGDGSVASAATARHRRAPEEERASTAAVPAPRAAPLPRKARTSLAKKRRRVRRDAVGGEEDASAAWGAALAATLASTERPYGADPRPGPPWPTKRDATWLPYSWLYYDERRTRARGSALALAGWALRNADMAEVAKAINAQPGFVESLSLRGQADLDDAAFDHFRVGQKGLQAVSTLDLHGLGALTDGAAHAVHHAFPNLTALDVGGATLTDAGVGHLVGGLRKLEQLRLDNVYALGNWGLQAISVELRNSRKLRVLSLAGCSQFGNEALLDMLEHGGGVLKELDMSRCEQLDDLGLLGLKRAGNASMNLVKLNVSLNKNLHDSAMGSIADGCKVLQELKINGCLRLTNSGLNYLATGGSGGLMKSLTSLDASDCLNLTGAGVVALVAPEGAGARLRHLEFARCFKMDDTAPAAVGASCPWLQTAGFFGCPKIGDKGLIALSRGCTHLRTANLAADLGALDVTTNCRLPRYGVPGIAELVGKAAKLKWLSLCGSARVNDKSLKAIGKLAGLETLLLTQCHGVTDAGLVLLAAGAAAASLTHLDISNAHTVGNAGVAALGARCGALERFECLGCRKVTDAGVVALAAGCPRLRHVSFGLCEHLTDVAVVALVDACGETLEALNLTSCDEVTQAGLDALARCRNLSALDLSFGTVKDGAVGALGAGLPFAKKASARKALSKCPEGVRFFNRAALEWQRRDRAGTAVGNCVRRYLARLRFLALRAERVGAATEIERMCRHRLALLELVRRRVRLALENASAAVVQKRFREYRARQRAKRIAAKLRRERKAAATIQRARRSYVARTAGRRVRMRHARILGSWSRIGWRVFDIAQIRHVKRAAVTVQRALRSNAAGRAFMKTVRAAQRLQGTIRCARARKVLKGKKADRLALLNQKALVLQGFWRCAAGMQAAVVRMRQRKEREYTEWVVDSAAARVVQAWWRRMRAWRFARAVIQEKQWIQWAVETIQVNTRYWLGRNMVAKIKSYKMRVIMRWKRCNDGLWDRHLASKAVVCQRAWRRELVRRFRITCAVRLQRNYRGVVTRRVFMGLVLDHKNDKAQIIQTSYRRFAFIMWAYRKKLLRHKSAHIIQRSFKAYITYCQWKGVKQKMVAAIAEDKRIEKETLIRKKQERFTKSIFERGEAIAISKIQVCFKLHVRARGKGSDERVKREVRLRELKEEDDRLEIVMAKKRNAQQADKQAASMLESIGTTLQTIVGLGEDEQTRKLREETNEIREQLGMATRPRDTLKKRLYRSIMDKKFDNKVDEKEANEVLDNSILNRQARSVALYGVTDIVFTCGQGEFIAFDEKQVWNKQTRKPVYVRIKKDLSGRKKEQIYIWFLMGTGKFVFTDLTMHRAPLNHTNHSVNSSRLYGMRMSGTTVCGHDMLDAEIHGFSAIAASQSAPAIDDIAVARGKKEEEDLIEKEWDRVPGNLGAFGLSKDMAIYCHKKAFHGKPTLNKVAETMLKKHDWYDERLETAMGAYGLSTQNIMGMHATYEEMNYAGFDTIEVPVLWEFHEEAKGDDGKFPVYLDWILRTCEVSSKTHVSFGEYVVVVSAWCMMGLPEVLRFIFGVFDVKKNSYLNEDQYTDLTAMLLRNNPIPFSRLKIQRLFHKFASEGGDASLGKMLFFSDFLVLMESYQVMVFPMMRLQSNLMAKNLGKKFWLTQKEKFTGARKRLKMKKI